MVLIFYFSSQPATESNELSVGITEMIVEQAEQVSSILTFNIVSFNHIVRKSAHFFLYLVLGVLVMSSFRKSKANKIWMIGKAIFVCVLYAISDEIHQLFVPGRGARVMDVFIDSTGAIVGVLVYLLIKQLKIPAEL